MAILHLTSDLPPKVSGGRSIAVAAIVGADPDAVALGQPPPPPAGPVREIVLHDPALLPRALGLARQFGAPLAVCVHILQTDLRVARGGEEPTRSEVLQAAALAAADRVIVPSAAMSGSAKVSTR